MQHDEHVKLFYALWDFAHRCLLHGVILMADSTLDQQKTKGKLSMKRRVVPVPAETSIVGLINASELRWHIANHPIWGTMTDVELAKHFQVSAGFVGMVRSGSRQPSKKFLEAAGFEAVTLYRMKSVSRRIGKPDGR